MRSTGNPKPPIGQLVEPGEGALADEELADQRQEKPIPSQGIFRYTSELSMTLRASDQDEVAALREARTGKQA